MCAGEYRGFPSTRAFISYAIARFKREREERAYRMYVTEQLRMIPSGKYFEQPWGDMFKEPPPDMDADEIIDLVASRGGLEVIG